MPVVGALIGCAWKAQAPGMIGNADVTPKLVVDKVHDADESDADRQHHHDFIADDGVLQAGMLPNEEPNRDDHTDQSAVKGHPAVPHGNEVNRIREIKRRVVPADDVVDHEEGPSTDEHTDQRIKKEVLDLVPGQAEALTTGRTAHPEIDQDKRHQIGDAVPMHFEWTEMNRDRIDVWIGEPVLHS